MGKREKIRRTRTGKITWVLYHLIVKKLFQSSDYSFIMQLLAGQFFLIRPSTQTDLQEEDSSLRLTYGRSVKLTEGFCAYEWVSSYIALLYVTVLCAVSARPLKKISLFTCLSVPYFFEKCGHSTVFEH